MVWKLFTQVQMNEVARQLFMPLILLLNYTLLIYLLTFYWSRRSEQRVRLLFAVGAAGVACLVPFSNPDDITVESLNDASETCCVLAFLLQITIIGHDLNKKIKFRTIQILTYVAELLIVADLAMVLLSLVVVFKHDVVTQDARKKELHNVSENLTLAFIFGFRYYYVIMSRGVQDLYTNRKVEICWLSMDQCETKLREASQASMNTRTPSIHTTQVPVRTRSAVESSRERRGKAYVVAADYKA